MTLRVALQMDALAAIRPASDSTLLLGLEAQARGYAIYHYGPQALTWREGRVTAEGRRVTLFANQAPHYKEEALEVLDLSSMDVILLRQDPPFDMGYITSTYFLEKLHPKPFVANHPASVRDLPEKLFPTLFAEFMPPTLITASVREIEQFRKSHRDIVIKPLYGFGGQSVFRLKEDDGNFHALMEMLFSPPGEPWVIQKFLPQVKTEDRRIIMIDGKIGGVMGRIPAEDEIRANFRVGGSPAKAELTKRQHEICEAVGPELEKRGIIFAGLDVIGDYLSEINITSPTGMITMNRLCGIKLEAQFWDALEAKL